LVYNLQNGLPYTVRPLSCLSDCLSVTLVYCGQMVGWIKMKLGMDVGLGPGHIVLDGDPTPKGAQPPNFWPTSVVPKRLYESRCHLVCLKVGLGPGYIVLDGDPGLTQRGTAPNFCPMLLWPNSWMGQNATWYRDRPR